MKHLNMKMVMSSILKNQIQFKKKVNKESNQTLVDLLTQVDLQ